jgi:drug/metabolite transporter (DMT)-like permease
MPADFQTASATCALGATLSWGLSDFVGGYASRRANAFLLTTLTHVSGTTLMTLLALHFHAPFPGRHSILWAAIAGLFGGFALAIFYRALAKGNMGLTAPVAAVLGAAIPTMFATVTEGMPGPVPVAGFFLAGIGIWLISRVEDSTAVPEGIGSALLAGLGFAAYFLCIKQAGEGSIFWLAAVSRFVSFFVTGAIVVATRQYKPMNLTGVGWAIGAGMLDSSGTAMFIRASQVGRLDTAVVISSLYPVVTVLLARIFLRERFSRWRFVGLVASLLAVPMIAWVTAP